MGIIERRIKRAIDRRLIREFKMGPKAWARGCLFAFLFWTVVLIIAVIVGRIH